MNRKDYAKWIGKNAKSAKPILDASVANIVTECKRPFLKFLLNVVMVLQKAAIIDGQKATGYFELLAIEAGREYPLWSKLFQVVGFFGEMTGDAVQGILDAWARGIGPDAEAGDSEKISETLIRVNALKAARSFIIRLNKFGAFNGFKNADIDLMTYEALSGMLFQADIPSTRFDAHLLETVVGRDHGSISGHSDDRKTDSNLLAIRQEMARLNTEMATLRLSGKKGKDARLKFSAKTLTEILAVNYGKVAIGAGQPEAEAGQPGQPEAEAGQPEAEAGQPEAEAGQPEAEAGQPEAEADKGKGKGKRDRKGKAAKA